VDVDVDLLAFVMASLPEPPSRVLEIGAGTGELAGELRAAGYAVTAIDPTAEAGSAVERLSLLEVRGVYDAAVAVVSLHHIDPLEESCAHLATLLEPGGRLIIDELDIERYDERVMRWWAQQRRALPDVGHEDHESDDDPAHVLIHMREHIHPLDRICAALQPYFDFGQPVRGPYLYRWGLRPSLRAVEVELIGERVLPATGALLVATRRP
jgi:SAM-dependent methyltransferase